MLARDLGEAVFEKGRGEGASLRLVDDLQRAGRRVEGGAQLAGAALVCGREVADVPRIIDGYLKVKDADAEEAAELVREFGLPWETLSSEHLAKLATWEALLEAGSLPLGALPRAA